jgi:DnaJ-class molecular chaperone
MRAPPADDYYELLGVDAGAGGEELRKAWRALAARWHPDRAGREGAHTFQRLSEAYRVLSDPLARMAYDRRRRAAGASAPRQATPPGPAARTARHTARPPAPAVMLSRISRPIQILLACGAANFDEPGFITLVLSESEAAQGGMVTIPMRVDLWCPQCAGERAGQCARRTPDPRCRRCGGTGTVEELFSAWLAVHPGVAAGEVLAPSVDLPGMVEPVHFRVRLARPRRAAGNVDG